MKLFFTSLIIFLAVDLVKAQPVAINEFMAKNESVIADQDGEYDDWIELRNNTEGAVDLSGYYLSDDPGDIMRWEFPDTMIAAGGFLIIWADEDAGQAGLHANFRLSAGGETIILSSPQGMVIDDISYEDMISDVSWGRYPDGWGTFRLMNPTPGGMNSPDYPAAASDSSDVIFCDTTVYDYNIHFYYDDWEDSLIYYFEVNDEAYIPAQFTYDNLTLDSIGVRYKGNSSYTLSGSTPKKPFKFKFDHYKPEQAFYGIKKLNFSNCVKDPSFLREKIGYGIARHYMPAPRTAYASLYIEGELLGFYVQVEQVDKDFLKRHFEDDSGNLFKAGNFGAAFEYRGPIQENYYPDFELKTNEALNDWSRLVEFIDKLNITPAADFVNVIQNYLNIDGCMRLLAFNMVLSNFDSYTGSGRNFYFYDNPVTDKFEIIPWDLNEAFGGYTNNWNVFTQHVVVTSNLLQRPLMGRIFENDSLRQVYMDYIAEMMNGAAAYDTVSEEADAAAQFIDAYVQADENKLYSYQNFLDNIENDVMVGLGMVIPGLKSFSQMRNANLALQLQMVRVYPGDTDNNGIVEAADILPIGIYFLQEGNPRPNGSLVWAGQEVLHWSAEVVTYADANGDGTVDESDVIGIGVNWGNSHEYALGTPPGGSFDSQTLQEHREDFAALFYALSGNSEAVVEMRDLLNSVFEFAGDIPAGFSLRQNYPNPFNSSTIIRFELPQSQTVNLTIYNLLGEEALLPIEAQEYSAGIHFVEIAASQISSGIYFYKLKTEKWEGIGKMVILK